MGDAPACAKAFGDPASSKCTPAFGRPAAHSLALGAHSLALDAHFLLGDEVLNDDVRHLVSVRVALVVQA